MEKRDLVELRPDERTLIQPVRDVAKLAMLETIRDTRDLTDLEWRFVRYLQRHEGQIRTYLQIADHLWGRPGKRVTAHDLEMRDGYASPYVRQIWTIVSNVRKKLEIDTGRPQHLATRRIAGYSWHDLPPGRGDGVDYVALHAEHVRLAQQMAFALGLNGDPIHGLGLPRTPQLGPEHPAYEGEVTESRSEPE